MTEREIKILSIEVPEVADPGLKARILEQLEDAELTYGLGIETAKAGIHFDEWPYRCIQAKEFRRGYMSAVKTVVRDDLTVSKDGELIFKAVN